MINIIIRTSNLKKQVMEKAWKGCQRGKDQTSPPWWPWWRSPWSSAWSSWNGRSQQEKGNIWPLACWCSFGDEGRSLDRSKPHLLERQTENQKYLDDDMYIMSDCLYLCHKKVTFPYSRDFVVSPVSRHFPCSVTPIRIQLILSFLLFLDTFGKCLKAGRFAKMSLLRWSLYMP